MDGEHFYGRGGVAQVWLLVATVDRMSDFSTDRSDHRPADHHHRSDICQSNVGTRVGHPPYLTAGQWRQQGAESVLD